MKVLDCVVANAHHPDRLDPRLILLGKSLPTAVRRLRRLLRPVPRKREGRLFRVTELLEHDPFAAAGLRAHTHAGRQDRTKFRNQVLKPLVKAGWLEMTVPDKPTSSRQKYRTTEAGRQTLGDVL